MGTHPIFESDFDCLTGKMNRSSKVGYGRARNVMSRVNNNNQSDQRTRAQNEIDKITERTNKVAINGRYNHGQCAEKSQSGDSGKASSESGSGSENAIPTLEELIQRKNAERAEEKARAEKEEFQD